MSRPPNTGAAEREREALIRRLERRLADFQAVPPARREAECADEGEQTCRALLAEIGAPRARFACAGANGRGHNNRRVAGRRGSAEHVVIAGALQPLDDVLPGAFLW